MSHESVRIKRLEAYMHLIALLIVVFVVGLYIGYWNGYSDWLYDCIDNKNEVTPENLNSKD